MTMTNRYRDQQASVVGIEEARRRLQLAQSEADFQRQVTDLAELTGWAWWHDTDSRRNKAGLPDLLLLRPPRLIFAELKKENGVLSPHQEAWLAALRQCKGVEAYLWRPSDFPRIQEVLKR